MIDAIEQLKEHHQRIHALFTEYRRHSARGIRDQALDQELMDKVCLELKILMQVEEELVYPAARRALLDADGVVDAARVEQTGLRYFIAQVEAGDSNDELTAKRFRVLGEQFADYVAEEQEVLFPRLRYSTMDMEKVGYALKARVEQLRADLATDTPFEGVVRPTAWERLAPVRA
jgi:hypothetical protein